MSYGSSDGSNDRTNRRMQVLLRGIKYDMRLLARQHELIEDAERALSEILIKRSEYGDQWYQRKLQEIETLISEYQQIPVEVNKSINRARNELTELKRA